MTFWDDIGDGWNQANSLWNSTVGAGLSWAENAPILGPALRVSQTATTDLFAPVDMAFSYGINRPVSTLLQVGEDNGFSNPDDWRNSWNRSATISPGQAAAIDYNHFSGNNGVGTSDFNMDDQSVAARNQYFSSGIGQLTSGVLDLALDLVGPAPLKLAKLAAIRNVTFASNAERDAVLAAARGEQAAATGRQGSLMTKLVKFARQTDDMTPAEIANHPLLYKADNGGAFAYFLGRINKEIEDPTERLHAKLDVIGAAMGNTPAIERLAAKRGDLMDQLNAMNGPPRSIVDASNIKAVDGGQSVIRTMNERGLLTDDGDFAKTAIENQLWRYQNVLDGEGGLGSINRVKGTWKEAVGSQIRQSEILGGLGARPVRVVTGAFIQRVPGLINMKDPVAGYGQLQTYLRNAYWVQKEDRDKLLAQFSQAVTSYDRAQVIDRAEEVVVAKTAAKYDISQPMARQLLNAGRLRANGMNTAIKSKLFSPDEEAGTVRVLDPEDGAIHVYDRPVLQSQIDSARTLPNPRQLDADFRRLKKSGALKTLGEDGLPITDGSSTMGDLANASMTIFTRAWKDAALMRGAYPFRIQVDDQARMLAKMGPLAYIANHSKTAKAIRTAMGQKNGDRVGIRELWKGNTDEIVHQMLLDLGIDEENIQGIRNAVEAKGGTIQDLLNESENAVLNKYRGSGQWAPIKFNEQGWIPAYKRALLQIQYSPTARAAARGLQGDDLRSFVMSDERAGREWRDLRRFQNNDFDGWLGKVERHVNTLLPDDYIRRRVSGADLPTSDEYLPIFKDGADELGPTGASYKVKQTGNVANDAQGAHRYSANLRDQDILGANKDLEWTDPLLQRLAAKTGATGQPPIGIAALHNLLSKTAFQKYASAATRGVGHLRLMAKKEFPDAGVDWDSIDNSIDMLDQIGKLKTKSSRFHSIYRPRRWDGQDASGAFDTGEEFHALGQRATMDELPDFEALAKQPLTDGEITRAYPDGDKAPTVHGESFSPFDKTSPGAVIGANYNRFRTWWYKFAAESPENVMSRFPLYSHLYKDNYKQIVARLKDAEGNITPELEHSARMSADRMARRDVGSILFDMTNTSNLAHSMRFISPFFGAWEDTMRKWWALSYDKPWVPIRLAQTWHMPNALGWVHDENGNTVKADGSVMDSETGKILDPVKDKALIGNQRFILLPSNYVPKAVKDATGIEQFKIRANSLDAIFGNQWWNPGAGPLVQVPTNEFVKHFWTSGENNGFVTNVVLGGMGVDPNDIPHQLMPAWMKPGSAVLGSVFGQPDDYQAAYKNILAYEMSLYNQGERPNPPTPDEIMGKTRMMLLIKTTATFWSPVSITPDPRGQFYIDQFHKIRQMYGKGSANPDVDPDQAFLEKFPGWFDMTATINANETGVNATLNAKDVAKQNMQFIRKNPELGWFFVGPENMYGLDDGSKYSTAAQSWLTNEGLRGHKDPWAAVHDAEVRKGWLDFQSGQTAFNLQLESAGYSSFQVKGAAQLADAHKEWLAGLMDKNPYWAKDYLDTSQGGPINLLDAAVGAFQQKPELMQRADMQVLVKYITLRQDVMAELAGRKQHTLQAQANADLAELWNQATSDMVKSNIGFEQMWNRVLQHDTLEQEIAGDRQQQV